MEDSDMIKTDKITNFIKGLIILVVAALILVGLDRILLLKSEDGISQLESIRKQKENTVDVIFCGSSHVYCDIATGVLWDNYGISAFDLGGAEAPAWATYYHLKDAFRNQKPKLVCYEISVAAIYPMLTQVDSWAADNNYGMSISKDRYEQLKANSEEKEFSKRLLPLGVMHSRYSDLCENDFKDVNNSINYKGFDPRERVYPMERQDMSGIKDTEPCSEKAEQYIRKIIELCRENDTELLFFVSPYRESEEERKIYNYIDQIADESGIPHINYNDFIDDIGLDFGCDFHDYTHLNFFGDYKFSDYLGKTLQEKYELSDHRGDINYQSWEIDAYKQRMERNNNTLAYAQHDAAEFMKNISSEGYDVFVTIKYGISEGLDEEKSQNLANVGIPVEKQLSGSSYIIRDGSIVAEMTNKFRASIGEEQTLLYVAEGQGDEPSTVSLFISDDEYKEDYDNLLFVYDYVNNIFVDKVNF